MLKHIALLPVLFFSIISCTPPIQPPDRPTPTKVGALTPVAMATLTSAPPTAQSTPALLPTPTPKPAVKRLLPVDVQLRLEPVIEGVTNPVLLTHAGDGSGRLFVVEKGGVIRLVINGQLQAEPFLDISERVTTSGNEQGLLGLVFALDYASSGFFWLNYTDIAGDTQIVRYQVAADNPNRADAASAFSVLNVDQPASNHNAGMLAFGPDGYLYVPLGDGGGGNRANGQKPDTLLGKILRLDVTSDLTQPYLIPPDNPFVTADWNGQDVLDEVWALGLRNPWRFSVDRATYDLWVGDVGASAYEEINFLPAGAPGGANFGWPLMEGMHCSGEASDCERSDLTLPILEYTHEGNCSVTGGYVYRGQAFPQWNGLYFYGDYCSGRIWAAATVRLGEWSNALVLDSDLSISSFGEDEAGELYVTDYRGGRVLRLAPGR
jgi:glucose/arabinose dehydrogenase